MFTGIIEEAGTITAVGQGRDSIELVVESKVCSKGIKVGDSLAVNGCCLTVVKLSGPSSVAVLRSKTAEGGLGRVGERDTKLHFDILRETWKRTNLQFAHQATLVNLERPLKASARFNGHFVTGHIDGIGSIIRWEQSGKDWVLEVLVSPEVMRYIVPKGSIAVDGISLTVAEVRKKSFLCWIIPHTRDATALRARTVSDAVNLEADILGKYVEKFVGARNLEP